jgi:hypothetical protein
MKHITVLRKWIKPAVFAAVGGALGCLYYFLFGRADSSSFLSAGILVSMGYFAVLGLLLCVFISGMKNSKQKDSKDQPR